MTEKPKRGVSRRAFLRLGGCAGITVVAGGIGAIVVDHETDFFDRLQGISDTPKLTDPAAWSYADNTLTLFLDQIPELSEPGSAVQLDNDTVPDPLLIVYGQDEAYYVYVNKCPHGDRKIDPVSGKLECTSISKSTFDYSGEVLSGPADKALTSYSVAITDDQLVVTLA